MYLFHSHVLFALFIHLSIVGPWPLLEFRNFLFLSQMVGLFRRGIRPSQGRYLHTGQHKHRMNAHTDILALNGIWTHDPSVRACEDSSCLRQRSHCDRLPPYYVQIFTSATCSQTPFLIYVRFPVLIAVVMKSYIVWDIRPRSSDLTVPTACFTLVSYSGYSSTLKREATCSSETLGDFHHTTWRYISEDKFSPTILRPRWPKHGLLMM
jgi:hypothetical protein